MEKVRGKNHESLELKLSKPQEILRCEVLFLSLIFFPFSFFVSNKHSPEY